MAAAFTTSALTEWASQHTVGVICNVTGSNPRGWSLSQTTNLPSSPLPAVQGKGINHNKAFCCNPHMLTCALPPQGAAVCQAGRQHTLNLQAQLRCTNVGHLQRQQQQQQLWSGAMRLTPQPLACQLPVYWQTVSVAQALPFTRNNSQAHMQHTFMRA